MATTNVKCPVCGTMNDNLYLEETGGWMECSACGSVTCSTGNKTEKGVKIPVYEIRWMKEYPREEKHVRECSGREVMRS